MRRLVSVALATPEYWPMTHNFSRYIPGSTPHVKGGCPGSPICCRYSSGGVATSSGV